MANVADIGWLIIRESDSVNVTQQLEAARESHWVLFYTIKTCLIKVDTYNFGTHKSFLH